jgi:hypothetical protein
MTVAIGRGAMSESRSLRAKASKHKVKTLALTLLAQNTQGRRITFRARVNDLER